MIPNNSPKSLRRLVQRLFPRDIGTAAAQMQSRRDLMRTGAFAVGAAGVSALTAKVAMACNNPNNPSCPSYGKRDPNSPTEMIMMPGFNTQQVDHAANGFNPTEVLRNFDYGKVSTLPSGQTLREYEIGGMEKTIEVAPGIAYNAFTYNGRIPGPTIRCREGDRIRIRFTNGSVHHHTMHFHGIHPGGMDGVYEQVRPEKEFTYEFDAEPFGVHLYHCHSSPLAKHISKGMYGAFIIDPKDPWAPADHELVMVMMGLDLDFDAKNDFYAVNGIPFHYDRNPIKIKVGELVRIFLVNILEFDPVNSFHLHANFFHYYPTGTSKTPSEFTDTILLGQGQRGMLEFRYKHPGKYMFHAHKTEFAELGWTGVFEVEGPPSVT